MRHTADTLRNVILSCHSIRDARNLSHECTDCCYCATGASLTAREATFGRCQGSCHPHTRHVGAPCTPSGSLSTICSATQWKSVSFSITATARAHNASSTVVRVSMTPEGHHVLSQLFDWQRFIYHSFYCSNGSW